MKNLFSKYKIKAKTFYTILLITILEIVMIIWLNGWQFSPAIIPPFIQFILMFEKRDIWDRMTEAEKEELTLSEDDVTNFIVGVAKKIKKGKTIEEIVKKVFD